MRFEFSKSCFFPRVLLRKGNIVSLSVTASFSRLFRTLIFFRPQRLRAFALHSTAENAQETAQRQTTTGTHERQRTNPVLLLSPLLFPFWLSRSSLALARFGSLLRRRPAPRGSCLRARKNYRPIAEVARMLLGVAYELLSPVILILYSFSPPRGTTELDLGGRRSRLDVHEDGDASICSLLTHDEPMLTCNPCSLATHEGAEQPMPMRRAIPRSAHFCP